MPLYLALNVTVVLTPLASFEPFLASLTPTTVLFCVNAAPVILVIVWLPGKLQYRFQLFSVVPVRFTKVTLAAKVVAVLLVTT